MSPVLQTLGLTAVNDGTWLGNKSISDASAPLIESVNPATGDVIASVRSTTPAEYEKLVAVAKESYVAWRAVPAPMRGEAVRRIGNSLRKYKDALGSLVTMEMGKIKAEGDGEVQEMIDIADFAVGQSRMLYGRTMHSERPQHRMYEQWHPLGLVGTISAFNFPVAVYSWNACIAAVCGNVNIWKPSPKAPLCGVAVQKIINEALADMDLPPVFFLINDGGNQLAQQFVDDKRVNLISFTGSTAVGRTLLAQAAPRVLRTSLELGGNAPFLVFDDADVERLLGSRRRDDAVCFPSKFVECIQQPTVDVGVAKSSIDLLQQSFSPIDLVQRDALGPCLGAQHRGFQDRGSRAGLLHQPR